MHTVLIWQSVLGTVLSGVNYLGQVGLETRVSLENVQVCALPIFYKAFLLCLIEAHSMQ